jgi:hypothetical protein
VVVLIPNGPPKNMASWNVELLMEGEFASISQVEGVQICTPTTINIKVPNRPTNHDAQTFWQV